MYYWVYILYIYSFILLFKWIILLALKESFAFKDLIGMYNVRCNGKFKKNLLKKKEN